MIYCFDTSVLLDNPTSLTAIGTDGDFILIPFCVLTELDKNKTRHDSAGKNSRDVIHTLDRLREKGSLHQGIQLDTGVTIKVVESSTGKTNDDRIIDVAGKNDARLVSNDISMCIRADALGVEAEKYDQPDQHSVYSGIKEVEVDSQLIDAFYDDNIIDLSLEMVAEQDLHPNQFIVMKSGSQSALGRVIFKDGWKALFVNKQRVWGINARNKEQEFALNLLTDRDVHLVSLVGRAGCGKSFLSLAAAAEQVMEKKLYEKVVIIRPVVSVGQDIGYLPGSLEEKMAPWMQPIMDNLAVLYKQNVEMLFEQGIFEVQALSFIRGRSIPKSFIIVDECQNLSLEQIKTVLTRAAEGSKIVLTGDIEQIDKTNMNVLTNGLSAVVEKMKHYTITGHMTLTKGQRSPLATIAAQTL